MRQTVGCFSVEQANIWNGASLKRGLKTDLPFAPGTGCDSLVLHQCQTVLLLIIAAQDALRRYDILICNGADNSDHVSHR